MPIDPEKALGAQLEDSEGSWDADRVILYHLGIGAGVPPTDPRELRYTFEKDLRVLPSFGVIPVFGALGKLGQIPGIQINFALLLHGEQDIEIHRPLPSTASIRSRGRVTGLYDKGRAALIVLEVETTDDAGEPLFTNRFSLFARGEGGFGGDPGPKPGNVRPERAPDLVVESPTVRQQALLYRLSGDKNPLHADPEFARLGGFDAPILHGLCSFGIVCKAAVDEVLDGEVERVARYGVRFAGVVFPGETIVTSLWRESDRILIDARTAQRDSPVISNGVIVLRD
jgi:acyl dehydratase